MRFDTYVKTQELTEGTFLFEQQVHRELQECTYEDWCVLLEDEKKPWWQDKGEKFQQDYIKKNPKSDTAKAIRSYLSTKDTPTTDTDKDVDVKTSSTDADEPSKDRYNEPLSKHPTLQKAVRAEWENLKRDVGQEFGTNLKNAIKEKSVFRAVKAVGLGSGKILLDGMKAVDSAVNFAADKVAATNAVQGLQKGLIKVDEFLDKYPKLKTVTGTAIAGFLTYQWLYMSFSGNLDSDYDLSSIPEAVAGNIGFTEILATPQGVKGMGLLAAGLATGGLSTLWLGGRKGMMMAAAYTGAKKTRG